MPKQKLKAGLLSTLFVVVLPEVEPGWERTGHQWSFIISKNNGGEIYGFWTSYWRCKIRNFDLMILEKKAFYNVGTKRYLHY
jgi:hypothetical protein